MADAEATASSAGGDRCAVRTSARVGFVARAALYMIVGVLAVQLASGTAEEDASQQGAMALVASTPFGAVLLGSLGLGLVGYAMFRAVEAVRGDGDGGVLMRRVVPAARAGVNGLLAFLALQELLEQAEGDAESSVTEAVLDLPGGTALVVAVGLVIVAVAVHQLRKAWTGDVHELADPSALPPRARRIASTVGRLGHLGRAAVFGLVGGFLIRAAITDEPDDGVGLDGALGEVVEAPLGPGLLTAVGAALVLFGVHCAVEAWYGRVIVDGQPGRP